MKTQKSMGVISEGPVVFVDIETDGMNHTNGHVIEVAAIRVEGGRVVNEFRSLVNPGSDIPFFITKLTGITSSDVADQPTFGEIAEELSQILAGAVFIAHNVRFDFSFLRQEFERVGIKFAPKQLCTVRLSRALYPDQTSHKLASLIERHNLTVGARHRAYDDAHALWQFIQLVEATFTSEQLSAATSKQFRHPSLPKHLERASIDALPDGHGVYIFEDDSGAPLYIGKSVTVKRRVLSHFTRDTREYREFKMAQLVHSVSAVPTSSELESLLLESQLIKQRQPLYNRRLRRVQKLIVAMSRSNNEGYLQVELKELDTIEPVDYGSILATYPRRGSAKLSIENTIKTFGLCPKLSGIEKAARECFSYQLKKCRGACGAHEAPEVYNTRLLSAFEHSRIESWPYAGPVIVKPTVHTGESTMTGFIVDQWRILASIRQEPYCEPVYQPYTVRFDLDSYKILRSFMKPGRGFMVQPFTQSFGFMDMTAA